VNGCGWAGGRSGLWDGTLTFRRTHLPPPNLCDRSGWYTLRAHGSKPHPLGERPVPFAETGAIYILCGQQPIRSHADAEYYIQ
jgi:hypothetical protein